MTFRNAVRLILLFGCAVVARGNVVLDWNALMIDAVRQDNSNPGVSTRNLAILHTAIFDAVNSVVRTHQPYQVLLPSSAETSVDAAATGAAHEVMLTLYPAVSARAEAQLQDFLAGQSLDPQVAAGIELGRTVARAILDSRSDDGASTQVPYIPSDLPGEWRRTPPFFRPPLAPHWRYVDLFALPAMEEFLPPPPPDLGSAEYATSLNEVKEIGGKTSVGRSPEQAEIATFWSDFSYTAMPPGHWNEIAAGIVREQGIPVADTARLFALLNLAQADAAIVCWEAKYRHNLWRPVTAIQRADENDNPLTEGDPAWDHLLAAPPFPSYPSGHSTFSKAAAQVLTHFFGTDALTFTATSDSMPGVRWSYNSLSACADEIGMSRVYGGIHFQFDNVGGKLSGAKIGDWVSANWLLPNDSLPRLQLLEVVNGVAQLRVQGRAGAQMITQRSEDLRHWEDISHDTAASGGVEVFDARSSSQHFYRVLMVE